VPALSAPSAPEKSRWDTLVEHKSDHAEKGQIASVARCSILPNGSRPAPGFEDADHRAPRKMPRPASSGSARGLRKRAQDLEALEPMQWNKLRIRAKTLRYTIEFFARLFPGKKNEERQAAAHRALKDLQDALGALNDLAAREKMAKEGHDLSTYAARLLGHGADKAEALLKDAEATYARFAEVKCFWK
jgi:CHAD domain-containing protein